MCMKSNFNLLFYIDFHLHFNENVAFLLRSALSARTLCHHGNALCLCPSAPQAQTKQMVN